MKTIHNIAWCIILFSIISCSSEKKKEDSRTVFRYNESKGIATLDPAYARNQIITWPVNQLFNGLVQLDNNLNLLPCIACKWEIDNRGKTYRFFLRDDVYFHDHPVFPNGKGRKVVAEDFVYSLNRIIDPKTASPGAWIFHHVDLTHVNSVNGFRAVHDTVLEIYLKQPFPAFLGILAMQYCSVVPHEIAEHYGNDFGRNPVGTGPFTFKIWREGEKLIFVKNDNYFENDPTGTPLPYLDAVVITFVNDKQSEFLEFMKGNLDFLNSVHKVYKDELLTRSGKLNPEYKDRIKMVKQEFLNTEYLGFLVDTSYALVQKSPAKYVEVRKAINYGFDRKTMMKYMRNNLGEPALAGFIPEGLPCYSENDVKGYEYNPDLARQLLSEAGFPDGEGLAPITLTSTSDYLDLCEYIQHELSQIGIKISIEVTTSATFRNNLARSKLAFFRNSWIADYPDAENYLALFYSPNFCPAGPNYTHFSSPAYDLLYEKALKELNDSIRYRHYQKMDQMIMDQAVIVPLYYDQVVRFTHKNMEGLGSNPLNLLVLKYVKKTNTDVHR